MSEVVDLVAAALRTTRRAILSRRRGSRPAAFARQVSMYLCVVGLELRPTLVARAFRRHWSTVIHALGRIEDLRDDREFDELLTNLEFRLGDRTKLSPANRLDGERYLSRRKYRLLLLCRVGIQMRPVRDAFDHAMR